MKTRIVYTKFWQDSFIEELSPQEKLLFLYFLTNESVNIIHLYELSDRKVKFETGVDQSTLDKAKEKFEKAGRIYFHPKGYVFLRNATRYEKYSGDLADKGRESLMSQIDPSVITWSQSLPLQPLEKEGISPLHRGLKGDNNNKQEVINNNTRDRVVKGKGVSDETLDDLLLHLNKAWGTKYQSLRPHEKNITYWLEIYSLEQIKEAITNATRETWLKDKLEPALFFRQTDKNKEAVDRIGTCLNLKPSESSAIKYSQWKGAA